MNWLLSICSPHVYPSIRLRHCFPALAQPAVLISAPESLSVNKLFVSEPLTSTLYQALIQRLLSIYTSVKDIHLELAPGLTNGQHHACFLTTF